MCLKKVVVLVKNSFQVKDHINISMDALSVIYKKLDLPTKVNSKTAKALVQVVVKKLRKVEGEQIEIDK